jgi:hypothetical protein
MGITGLCKGVCVIPVDSNWCWLAVELRLIDVESLGRGKWRR